MTGTLFVVATPIGNLGDLSPRAAQVLREVDLIAAEDTRQTSKLASHVGSRASFVSLHAHSSDQRITQVLEALSSGRDVALTTDAGTPGVADPGPKLIAAAHEAGIPVRPIPGPSAVSTILMASGFPADRYLFLGFPPRKGTGREEWLARLREADYPVVCFESANRAHELVVDLATVCGADRGVVLGREMTKHFEEYRRTRLGVLARDLETSPPKGEITLVVEGLPERPSIEPDRVGAEEIAAALVEAGLERSRVAKAVAKAYGLSRNESYRMVVREDP